MDYLKKSACRTCLSEGELKSVFDKIVIDDSGLVLCEMVTECTSVKIMKHDDLPDKMCDSCIGSVKQAYTFKKQCENVDNILRSQLKDVKNEWNYKDQKEYIECPIIKCESSVDSLNTNYSKNKSRHFDDICKTEITEDFTPEHLGHTQSESELENESCISKTNKIDAEKDSIDCRERKIKSQPWKKCTKCNETFTKRYHWLKHRRTKHREKEFDCLKCHKCFVSKNRFLNHACVHTEKSDGPVVCQICGLKFAKSVYLRQHNMIHTDGKTHVCHVCKKTFRYLTSLKNHLNFHSTEAPLMCEHCSKPYRTVKALRFHIKKIHSDLETGKTDSNEGKNYFHDSERDTFVCNICSRVFPTIVSIREHCVHHGKRRKCDKCGEMCEKKSELLKHKLLQHGESQIQCDECKKCFSNYSLLRKHSVVHTGETPFTCENCGLKFRYSGNLQRHMKLHRGERPHVCHICNKAFVQGPSLANHIRVHTKEKPFQCKYCEKCYSAACTLYEHERRKHLGIETVRKPHQSNRRVTPIAAGLKIKNEKVKGEFLCSECGKKYTTKAGLDLHSNIHIGVKPYHCATCGKSFSQISGLKSHSYLHTGERPFKCTLCGRGFTQSQHVVVHMRTHTGERPFECNLCGKSFALRKNLTVHIRIHTGETPYQCPICGKGFKSSNNMKKHQRIHVDKQK